MTLKQLYISTLIELGKINAPSITLAEFNYYANKAVTQYVNWIYNFFDTNQQTTDDLRVLQSSVYLVPEKITAYDKPAVSRSDIGDGLYKGTYYTYLPMDYVHLLSCVCTFHGSKNSKKKCSDNDSGYFYVGATRLTSDAWPLVLEDVYNKPSIDRPYYMIYSQNRENLGTLPVDPIRTIDGAKDGENSTEGNDINGLYDVDSFDSDKLATDGESGGNFPRTFTFSSGRKESLVKKTAAVRISNPQGIRLEIRCGTWTPELVEIQVDYIKAPQYLLLTQDQLDLTQDVSQILEWPDYVSGEIINMLLRLIMERSSDPRLTTKNQIDQTIDRSQALSSK